MATNLPSASGGDVPPMLPMARAESALIDFARDVISILSQHDGLYADDRVRRIVLQAVTRNVADAVCQLHPCEPVLVPRSIDGGAR